MSAGLACIALLMGMAGELYLQVPGAGVIPMLDLFSYGTSWIVIFSQWSHMGRHMRRMIKFAFAWTLAAAFANAMNFYDLQYYFKCVAVVSSSWAVMSIAYYVLRMDARLFIWWLIGWAIGRFVALYYFSPGTFLAYEAKQGISVIETLNRKEIYPIYAYLFIFVLGALPTLLFTQLSAIVPLVGTMIGAFYLLIRSGSRANFGMWIASAACGFGACYMRNMTRRLSKKPMLLFAIVVVAVGSIFGIYKYLALSGSMGASEKEKYIHQFVESDEEHQGIVGRGAFVETWHTFLKQPWGAGGTAVRHSVISNSWNCEGVVGLAFWVFFYFQIFWFVRNRLFYARRFAIFLALVLARTCWCALGSPFGGRSLFFFTMTFIALCRDHPAYGLDSLFDLDRSSLRLPFVTDEVYDEAQSQFTIRRSPR